LTLQTRRKLMVSDKDFPWLNLLWCRTVLVDCSFGGWIRAYIPKDCFQGLFLSKSMQIVEQNSAGKHWGPDGRLNV
jgi:hypothetical protein